jgi:hypothetical protein
MSVAIKSYDINGMSFQEQIDFVNQRMGQPVGKNIHHRATIFKTVNQIDHKHSTKTKLKRAFIIIGATLVTLSPFILSKADQDHPEKLPAGLLALGVGLYCGIRAREISEEKRKTASAMFALAVHADWDFNTPRKLASVAKQLAF